jgi:hypothetical protein
MVDIKIIYDKNNVNLSYNITKNNFYSTISNEDVVRYLKGVFRNKNRFEHRFINEIKSVYGKVLEMEKNGELDFYKETKPEMFMCDDNMDELLELYDNVKAFTYAEAFALETQEFQTLVFGSIDIVEMISELGHERLCTDGKPVKHKVFSETGELLGYNALRCWCTTTNKEHWLWIEEEYKDSPLEAVASTFRIHENLIPHIKELKRQGDVLLVEMEEDVKPEGEIVPLTSEQYFSLLTCQS